MRALNLAALILVSTLPAACAGGGGPGGSPRWAELGRERLFVSPSGEPFRSRPGGPRPIALWFASVDADRNGALSAAEFTADAGRAFARLAGADDLIDDAEVSAFERDIVPEMQPDRGGAAPRPEPDGVSDIIRLPDDGPGRRGGRGGRGGFNVYGAAPFGLTGEPHPLLAADFDQSRGVSRAEFLRATATRFRALDAAGDGALTLTELDAIRPPRAQGGRRRPRGED